MINLFGFRSVETYLYVSITYFYGHLISYYGAMTYFIVL